MLQTTTVHLMYMCLTNYGWEPFTFYLYALPTTYHGTSHYGNAPGYSRNQTPFSQVTGVFQQGVPTNGHAFQPQMAQGTTNPNYVQRHDVPMGGYQNQSFIPNPKPMYDQLESMRNGNMGYPGRNRDHLAAQVEALVQRLVGNT